MQQLRSILTSAAIQLPNAVDHSNIITQRNSAYLTLEITAKSRSGNLAAADAAAACSCCQALARPACICSYSQWYMVSSGATEVKLWSTLTPVDFSSSHSDATSEIVKLLFLNRMHVSSATTSNLQTVNLQPMLAAISVTKQIL